jgi:hypothetical protein
MRCPLTAEVISTRLYLGGCRRVPSPGPGAGAGGYGGRGSNPPCSEDAPAYPPGTASRKFDALSGKRSSRRRLSRAGQVRLCRSTCGLSERFSRPILSVTERLFSGLRQAFAGSKPRRDSTALARSIFIAYSVSHSSIPAARMLTRRPWARGANAINAIRLSTRPNPVGPGP